MTSDVPDPAQPTRRVQDKTSLLQRLRRAWTWLDRIDPARLIGGSDVFK